MDDTAQGKGGRNDSAYARGKDVLCDEYLSKSGRYANRSSCLVVMSVILRKWHYRITMEHVKVIKLWLTSGKLKKKLLVNDAV